MHPFPARHIPLHISISAHSCSAARQDFSEVSPSMAPSPGGKEKEGGRQ